MCMRREGVRSCQGHAPAARMVRVASVLLSVTGCLCLTPALSAAGDDGVQGRLRRWPWTGHGGGWLKSHCCAGESGPAACGAVAGGREAGLGWECCCGACGHAKFPHTSPLGAQGASMDEIPCPISGVCVDTVQPGSLVAVCWLFIVLADSDQTPSLDQVVEYACVIRMKHTRCVIRRKHTRLWVELLWHHNSSGTTSGRCAHLLVGKATDAWSSGTANRWRVPLFLLRAIPASKTKQEPLLLQVCPCLLCVGAARAHGAGTLQAVVVFTCSLEAAPWKPLLLRLQRGRSVRMQTTDPRRGCPVRMQVTMRGCQ